VKKEEEGKQGRERR